MATGRRNEGHVVMAGLEGDWQFKGDHAPSKPWDRQIAAVRIVHTPASLIDWCGHRQ